MLILEIYLIPSAPGAPHPRAREIDRLGMKDCTFLVPQFLQFPQFPLNLDIVQTGMLKAARLTAVHFMAICQPENCLSGLRHEDHRLQSTAWAFAPKPRLDRSRSATQRLSDMCATPFRNPPRRYPILAWLEDPSMHISCSSRLSCRGVDSSHSR